MKGGISRTAVNSILSDYLALENVLRDRSLNNEADFTSISLIDLNNTLQKNMSSLFENLKPIVECFGSLGIVKSPECSAMDKSRVKSTQQDIK